LWLAKHPRRHRADPPEFGWLQIAALIVFLTLVLTAVLD
jgi:hypothetical protein